MTDDISSRESEALLLYDQQDYTAAKEIFQDLLDSSQDVSDDERTRLKFNIASCQASRGNLDEAMRLLSTIEGSSNCLLFNKALCEYKCGNLFKAVALLDEIIINCEKVHPDLMIIDERQLNRGSPIDADLGESCLIEAINLKAACRFKISGDKREAKEILALCPIKSQELLDAVTLFNQALYEYRPDATNQSVNKFSYLYEWSQQHNFKNVSQDISQNFFILLIESDQLNLATDLLQNIRDGPEQPNELLKYFELILESNNLDEDVAFEKMDLFLDHILRMIKNSNPTSSSSKSTRHQLVELAMSIIDHQCNILWATNRYKHMEKFLQKVKFVYQPDYVELWSKNMAHLLFVMDTRYKECSQIYEKFLPKNNSNNGETLNDVDPTILSNLCVSYILMNRVADAEALLKEIEAEEQEIESRMNSPDYEDLSVIPKSSEDESSGQPSQLHMINLAIDIVYCLKNNYEFGLTRMLKRIESHERLLNLQMWFYVKRCILSLVDSHCRQLIYLRDDLLDRIISFLMRCEKASIQMNPNMGRNNNMLVSSKSSLFQSTSGTSWPHQSHQESPTIRDCEIITTESRYLRSILLAIIHD